MHFLRIYPNFSSSTILGSNFTIFLVPSLLKEFNKILEHLHSLWGHGFWKWYNDTEIWKTSCAGGCGGSHGISFPFSSLPSPGDNQARVRMQPKLHCCLGRKQRKLAFLQKPVQGQGRALQSITLTSQSICSSVISHLQLPSNSCLKFIGGKFLRMGPNGIRLSLSKAGLYSETHESGAYVLLCEEGSAISPMVGSEMQSFTTVATCTCN